jgi:CRP/FNR family cyclic AMP-dependent transcriptional regulator
MQAITVSGLKQIPCFSDVPAVTLNALAEKARPVKFAKGDTIIHEGEQTRALYIVVSGKVKALTHYAADRKVDLLILEPGGYFGEMALLTDEPRAATVSAIEKTVCAVIAKADFKSWLKDYPAIDINLLRILSEKVGYLNEKTHQMALSGVYEKTVTALKSLAQQQGNNLVIPVRPTVHELAELTGASSQMVKVVMQELSKNKYVVAKGKALHVASILPESW